MIRTWNLTALCPTEEWLRHASASLDRVRAMAALGQWSTRYSKLPDDMIVDLAVLQAAYDGELLLKTELAEGHEKLHLDKGEFVFTGLYSYENYGRWLTFTTTPDVGTQEWYWPLTGVQYDDDKKHPLYATQVIYSEFIVGLPYQPDTRVDALFVVPTHDHSVPRADNHAVAPASWVFETFAAGLVATG